MGKINENIAQNIIKLRKQQKWTQQDLASKLNYSDKAISKWERGDSIPDIEMLCELANIFNVNVDFLTKDHSEYEIDKIMDNKMLFVRNLLIMISLCVSVFFVSTIVFIYPTLLNPYNAEKFWVSFVFALPICSLICNRYARKYNYWLMRMISISALVWTLITSLFTLSLVIGAKNLWMLFLIGIPIQASICLFFFWKKTF